MERMQRFDWYCQRPREVWKLLGSRGDGNYQRSIVHCARKNGRVVATVRVVCYSAGEGCNGGNVVDTLQEAMEKGLPTGGMLGDSSSACLPYEFEA